MRTVGGFRRYEVLGVMPGTELVELVKQSTSEKGQITLHLIAREQLDEFTARTRTATVEDLIVTVTTLHLGADGHMLGLLQPNGWHCRINWDENITLQVFDPGPN